MHHLRLPASLILLSALAACGGNDGGIDTAQPVQVTGALQKYAGEWKQSCSSHSRESSTLVATGNGAILSFISKIEYFANADCTGGVVATGMYSEPSIVLQYKGTIKDASIKLASGETVAVNVDQGDASATTVPITFAGSGVTSTIVNGKTVWRITFSQGYTEVKGNLGTGTVKAALALRNGELLLLAPLGNTGNSFEVQNHMTH